MTSQSLRGSQDYDKISQEILLTEKTDAREGGRRVKNSEVVRKSSTIGTDKSPGDYVNHVTIRVSEGEFNETVESQWEEEKAGTE